MDKFDAYLNNAINTKDNPTGKYLTSSVKKAINNIATKLPTCHLIKLDHTSYPDNMKLEKDLLFVDFVIGQRLGNEGYFKFKKGKEIPEFPDEVFTNNIQKVDRDDHKKTLRYMYKESGKEGIQNYVTLIYSRVTLFDVTDITSANLINNTQANLEETA